MRLVIFLITLCLSLCLSAQSQADIIFGSVKVPPVPPNMTMASGYLTLQNTSSKDIILTKVTSNLSEKAEFHSHVWQNGVAKMIKLDSLLVPANTRVTFQSGGKHIMLIKLKKDRHKMDSIVFTFIDSNGKSYTAKTHKVTPLTPPSPTKHQDEQTHNHNHHHNHYHNHH